MDEIGSISIGQPPELSHVTEHYSGAPDPTKPGSAYREAKPLAELLCAIYQKEYDLKITVARCFAFVGPHLPLDAHFAVDNFIRDSLAGGPIYVSGDGTPFRSYLYAADLAIWLWTILFRGQSWRAYNIGSDQAISISDLARRVSSCFPKPPEVVIGQTPVSGRPTVRYVPCIDRAKHELGFQCCIDLDEAIKRTIQFYE